MCYSFCGLPSLKVGLRDDISFSIVCTMCPKTASPKIQPRRVGCQMSPTRATSSPSRCRVVVVASSSSPRRRRFVHSGRRGSVVEASSSRRRAPSSSSCRRGVVVASSSLRRRRSELRSCTGRAPGHPHLRSRRCVVMWSSDRRRVVGHRLPAQIVNPSFLQAGQLHQLTLTLPQIVCAECKTGPTTKVSF